MIEYMKEHAWLTAGVVLFIVVFGRGLVRRAVHWFRDRFF